MDLPLPIRVYGYSTNALERVNKKIKCRQKRMEKFPNENIAKKYLYAILSKMSDDFLKRRLKNWEFYYNIYQEQKNAAIAPKKKQTKLT